MPLTYYANGLYCAQVRIEWDQNKNLENRRRHELSFEEASELFESGTDYLEIFDEYHSVTEDRFICIGPIPVGVILVVKTEPADDVLRIVSARRATKRETKLYKDYMEGREG